MCIAEAYGFRKFPVCSQGLKPNKSGKHVPYTAAANELLTASFLSRHFFDKFAEPGGALRFICRVVDRRRRLAGTNMSRNDETRRDRNDAAATEQRHCEIRRPYDSSQLDRVPRPPDLNTPYGAWWVIE
jgi:hypothetical protein